MSNGRKIFRFLKFLEDLKEIYKILFQKASYSKVTKALLYIFGCFYHMFDNLVWLSSMGIIGEYISGDVQIKHFKNCFSLLRNLLKIGRDVFKFQKYYTINKYNEEEITENFDKKISNFNHQAYCKMIRQVIESRNKLRMKTVDIIHSSLRTFIVLNSMKLEPFYSNIHPIFIGCCGIAHASIAITKEFLTAIDHFKANNLSNSNLNIANVKNNLEKAIIDSENVHTPQIFNEDYLKVYYIDFNKNFRNDYNGFKDLVLIEN